MADNGLILGKITDASLELMRRRIGYPNPTIRAGILAGVPWNSVASADTIRHWLTGIGDDNPLYIDPSYAADSRWGEIIAPPGYDTTMGFDRSRKMTPEFEKETRAALRGVHLFNSGTETFFHAPIRLGTKLYKSGWVASVVERKSRFGGKSAIVTNEHAMWTEAEEVLITGSSWFVHVERETKAEKEKRTKSEGVKIQQATFEPYTDEQLAEIEEAYENEYRRGKDTLYLEDVKIGDQLPKMVKGPFTITDHINFYMGWGWGPYGNPPHRLAYENRKLMRGFYSKNEFGAWDTVQRLHWDASLADTVGVQSTYDIGPNRYSMVCNYCTNWAGDDGWVHRIRCEYRNFNYVGDTTWITGEIVDASVDDVLGPKIEVKITGTNQRGEENIRAEATILCSSRNHGQLKLPPLPPMPEYRD